MKKLLLALPLLLILILSCSKETPLSTEENSQRGTISGVVTVGGTAKLSGVAVTLDVAGYTTTTDTSGNYTIPDVPKGEYDITFTKTNYHDTTVSSISISKAEDVVSVDMSMTFNPDETLIERDITGALTGDLDDIAKIEAILTGDSIPKDEPIIQELTWYPNSKKYSGFIYRPKEGVVWNVAIKVYDSKGRVTGYSKMDFDKLAGDVAMPAFSSENAKPQITILSDFSDTAFGVGDTVDVKFRVDDAYGHPVSYQAKSFNGDYIDCDSGVVKIIVGYDSCGLKKPLCEIESVDDEGNINNSTAYANLGLFNKDLGIKVTVISIKNVSDGGFIILGNTSSNGDMLIRLDKNGDTLWTKKIDNSKFSANSLLESKDGGFFITGLISSDTADWAITKKMDIIKTNSFGEPIWEKSYGDSSSSWEKPKYSASGLLENGDVLIGGYKDEWKSFLFRVSNDGDLIWGTEVKYPDGNLYSMKSLSKTSDGGFLILQNYNYRGVPIFKIDSTGAMQDGWLWPGDDVTVSCIETNDRNYIVCNLHSIIKLDGHSNVIWRKDFDSKILSDVFETSQNRYLVIDIDYNNLELQILDVNGELVSKKIYNNGLKRSVAYAIKSNDGGVVVLSEIESSSLQILKIDMKGNFISPK